MASEKVEFAERDLVIARFAKRYKKRADLNIAFQQLENGTARTTIIYDTFTKCAGKIRQKLTITFERKITKYK